jgi:hypothetical protein
MHEYMLASKSTEYTKKQPNYVELTPLEYAETDSEQNSDSDIFDAAVQETDQNDKLGPEEKILRHQKARAQRKSETTDNKRTLNLLAGLCAVLFVVSFIMGVGLVRNQERLERMEYEMRHLVAAHLNLFHQVSSHEMTPVFAEAQGVPPSQGGPAAQGGQAAQGVPPSQGGQAAQVIGDNIVYEPQDAPIIYVPQAELPSDPGEEEALIPLIPEAYTIQPGDSLIAISLYFYGDASMVDAILVLNGLDDPNHIVAGAQ